MKIRLTAALLVALALIVTACSSDDTADSAAAEADGDAATGAETDTTGGGASGPLAGTLTVTAGECADGAVTTGSWFRMVQPNGSVADGPFVENGDSPCGDTTWTPLFPGADDGLVLGTYQPLPDPIFDEAGNALADAIVQPTTFFAVDFAVATNESDPQTELGVPAPTVEHDGAGNLSGDLSAWGVAYNGAHFNQGTPKPDGSMDGNTTSLTGTYDPDSGAYTLEWSSQIVGGPFNNFTGIWHLEGTVDG